MKILVLSDLYPPYYQGGYEINCKLIVDGLIARGHQVFVLTSTYGCSNQETTGNIFRLMYTLHETSKVFMNKFIIHTLNGYLARKNYYIARHLAINLKPDIAYVWQNSHVSLFPAKAVSDCNVTCVYNLCDYWLSNFKSRFTAKNQNLTRRIVNFLYGSHIFQKLDHSKLITISNALKRHYILNNFSVNSMHTIPIGIPSNLIRDYPENIFVNTRNNINLIYAGRLVREKGVHVAIEALSYYIKTHNNNVLLDIFGNGNSNYVDELKNLIASEGMKNNVNIHNQITREKLIASFDDYFALLFPSIWDEPFGMTIIEAMSRGIPVIGSNVGGVPNIIEDSENSLLVPPNNPKELASAINRLISDNLLYNRLRINCIKTVREKFNLESIVDETEKYLTHILFEKIH